MQKTSKPLWVFLLSFSVCLAACAVAVFPMLISSNEPTVAADTGYNSAPYENLNTSIMLGVADAPVDFYIEISVVSGCSVTCLPKAAVKNSKEFLSPTASEYEKAEFIGKKAAHKISANTSAITILTNKLGGITCDTPYGLPAPSGNNQSLALNETLHFYGSSVAEMLLAERTPSSEQMTFYAKLIALVVSKFLSQPSKENYILLNSICDTDISYANYYDNCNKLTAAAKNIKSTTPAGVWMNNNYYIY